MTKMSNIVESHSASYCADAETSVPDEQDRTAFEYDTWIENQSLMGRWMRFLLSPTAVFVHNTQAWKLVPALRIRPYDRVLDVGCGYGSLLIYLQNRIGFRSGLVGVDVSAHMVRHAEREIRKRNLQNVISVEQAKATALPFEDNSFDVILSTYMIKHLSDDSLNKMLGEVHRVLKPGGRFCFWEVGPSRLDSFTGLYKKFLSKEVSTTNLRSWSTLEALLHQYDFRTLPFGRRGFYFLCPTMPRVGFIAIKG